MAENNEELEQIKQMTSAEQLLESIEGKADPFAGYSLEELRSVLSVINGFADSKAKEAVMATLQDAISKQTNDQPQEAQPSPADSQTKEDDLPHTEFMNVPSYSLYKNYQGLVNKFNNGEANETDGLLIKDYIDNAKKIVDLAANEDVTPEQAVFLKDYLEILNSTVEEGKKYNEELEAKVDEQLKVFDEENGLEVLENDSVNAEELYKREEFLYGLADSRIKTKYGDTPLSEDEKENIDVIKHLAVQEMKSAPLYPDDKLFEEIAQKAGITADDAKAIFEKGENGGELNEAQQEVFKAINDIFLVRKAEEFDTKFKDLEAQFEAVKMTELAKLEAEEVYPVTKEMSNEELMEILEKRAAYIADNTPENKEEWVEKNAVRALRKTLDDEENKLSDEDLLKKYGKEIAEFKADYEGKAAKAEESTKVAFALKTEMLADRTARLTNSPDIHPQTKGFLNDFAKKHPQMYAYGKIALTAGKKSVIRQIIAHTAGLNGLAVYSTYETLKSFKKSYNEYLEAGGEKGFKNFVAYLRKPENRDKRINLIKQAAISGVAIGAAVAGNVTGMGILGAAMAPVIKRVATGVVSTAAESLKVAGNLKDWNKARKSGDKEAQKAASKKLKKSWLGLGVAVAGFVGAGWLVKHFAENGSENEGLTDAEREQILKNTEDLSKNSTGDITDPLNLKGGENAATETAGGENSENNAADAAQATADQYADFDLYSDSQTVNNINQFTGYPAFSAQKLHELGLIDKETEQELSGTGGTRKTLAKLRELNDNATPEQKAKLAEYKEWINDRSARNAEIIKYNNEHGIGKSNSDHLAKVRAAAEAAEQRAGDQSAQVVQEEQNQEEQKMATVNFSQNKAFAGITTKHGVSTPEVTVKEQNQAYQTIRNAAERAHADDPKFKHADATYVDEKGNKVNAEVTVTGNEEKGLKIKTKVENPDGSKMKENLKLKNGVYSMKYKNAAFEDINNDEVKDQLVAKTAYGTTSYEAYKASDGKEYVVQKEYDLDKKEWQETERHESKNAKSEVTKIAKAQRKAFEKGGR